MTRSASRLPLLILVVLLLLGALVAWLASRQTSDLASYSPAYAPDAYVHGASLETWNARQWQWTLGIPAGLNPGHDATGESCTLGQWGPVVFIPHNLAPCTVPEGAVVLIPVVNAECSSVEGDPYTGENEAALQACAAAEADRYVNIAVTVNGESIDDIQRYRATTDPFTVMLPERNVLGATPGAARVAADGYAVLLRPLPPGEHTVIVHTETVEGVVLPDKLLRLTVVEPAWGASPAGTPEATPGATPMPR